MIISSMKVAVQRNTAVFGGAIPRNGIRSHLRAVSRKPVIVSNILGRNETSEEAKARRLRESDAIQNRVTTVSTISELDDVLDKAGNKLIILEIASEQHCMIDEEHEISPSSCIQLKHSFQRTARDCSDALFVEVLVDDLNADLVENLGVTTLPTLQFVKQGRLLWEHRGVSNLDQDLAEGVLFYGDQGAGGFHPSDIITEINSTAEFEKWKSSLYDKVLGVLDVSMTNAAPCVHIFPTVVVLARQFKGFASFARLLGDANEETKELMKQLDIESVPTFTFYRNGERVGQHIGSSRSDLISSILSKQAELGIMPPPPLEGGRRAQMKQAAEKMKEASDPRKQKRWNSFY